MADPTTETADIVSSAYFRSWIGPGLARLACGKDDQQNTSTQSIPSTPPCLLLIILLNPATRCEAEVNPDNYIARASLACGKALFAVTTRHVRSAAVSQRLIVHEANCEIGQRRSVC